MAAQKTFATACSMNSAWLKTMRYSNPSGKRPFFFSDSNLCFTAWATFTVLASPSL